MVARQAGSTNLGPHGVDSARGRDADVPHKGRTATAHAAHASALLIDEGGRDASEIGVGLEREPRPLRRIGATRAAGATDVRVVVHYMPA